MKNTTLFTVIFGLLLSLTTVYAATNQAPAKKVKQRPPPLSLAPNHTETLPIIDQLPPAITNAEITSSRVITPIKLPETIT